MKRFRATLVFWERKRLAHPRTLCSGHDEFTFAVLSHSHDQPVGVVWFKRDLRLSDHRPLQEACQRGKVVCLYCFEPSFWRADDADGSHFRFVTESLMELREGLRARGGELIIRVGEVLEVLEELRKGTGFQDLWSHEETGNLLTFNRDKRVKSWTEGRGVRWREIPQTGVVRGLKSRDGWAALWKKRMAEPLTETPDRVECPDGLAPGNIPDPRDVGLEESTKLNAQKGGAKLAWETMHSFLQERGVGYRKEMSSPLTGEASCSRLSPYLAWGNISIREVFQSTRDRIMDVRYAREEGRPLDKRWAQSLSSFEGRLRWHCHFMQKFEDEPAIEFENMNRAFDGLREGEFRQDRFEAWCRGETGYPMVDACMRALHQTGWINFRMRAMLVSFASYHLWLHWRQTAVFLARHFLDYEPGIHFSQFQMQSGVTGINTLRIYSPAKQVVDQDPEGEFLRRFCPELEGVPKVYLAEPHRMPGVLQEKIGCQIGKDYPRPVVMHREAYAMARQRMGEIRKRPEVRTESFRVQERHGSRRKGGRKRKR
ncbi:MAG: deoxyribodipyrimidine photolyase [Roseibacillus sp.]|nr:deoxyribodipyrimidine photolyase [Roseibacillus sp.]MBQ63520.1 deoxyribodipyrimidine photolyase [Euryarchaeota archaeon]